MRTNSIQLALGISLLVFINGCGGGKSAPVQPTTIPLETRQLQVGDKFNYSVAIDINPTPPLTPSAIRTDSVQYSSHATKYGGRPLILHRQLRQTIDGETHSYDTITFIEQTLDGTIYYSGSKYRQDYGDWTERMIQSSDKPALYVPKNLQVGESYAFTAFWSDGENSRVTKRIVGIETHGSIQSYAVSSSSHDGTYEECFAPALGWYCKEIAIDEKPYGRVTSTYVLDSKNF